MHVALRQLRQIMARMVKGELGMRLLAWRESMRDAKAAKNAAGDLLSGRKGGNSAGVADVAENPKVSQPPSTQADEMWRGNAPDQVEPGITHIQHEKYNPRTGELEVSDVEYDQYGRQVYRTDHTDHGYPSDHSNPHSHEREYGLGYGPKGRESRINKPDDKISN